MGKYLKLFDNHSQYETFIGGGDSPFVRPNVSHCIQENEVHYNPTKYRKFTVKGLVQYFYNNVIKIPMYTTKEGYENFIQNVCLYAHNNLNIRFRNVLSYPSYDYQQYLTSTDEPSLVFDPDGNMLTFPSSYSGEMETIHIDIDVAGQASMNYDNEEWGYAADVGFGGKAETYNGYRVFKIRYFGPLSNFGTLPSDFSFEERCKYITQNMRIMFDANDNAVLAIDNGDGTYELNPQYYTLSSGPYYGEETFSIALMHNTNQLLNDLLDLYVLYAREKIMDIVLRGDWSAFDYDWNDFVDPTTSLGIQNTPDDDDTYDIMNNTYSNLRAIVGEGNRIPLLSDYTILVPEDFCRRFETFDWQDYEMPYSQECDTY